MIETMKLIETVHSRFLKVVAEHSGKVAIDDNRTKWTYEELSSAVNKIASAIERSSKNQHQLIAILSNQHINTIATMLGVAYTSHAFVILNTQDPNERLSYVIQDCKPSLILADRTLMIRVGSIASHVDTLCLDDLLSESLESQLPCCVNPEDPFYIVYTSGSTGQPKGVIQTQKNLLFYIDAYTETLGISNSDRLSMVYTLSFSASNLDVFSALLNGATLYTYPMREQGIPILANWILKKQITVLHCVPTVLRELTRSISTSITFESIRVIDLGGEMLLAEDIIRFRKYTNKNAFFVNHLAATELSVISQIVLKSGDEISAGIISVGKSPIGVNVKILRNSIESCADINEIGLISIESQYLSPGYYGRPDLDELVFSNMNKPGWRRYISGDMGRIDEKGNLHFIGRTASRIKLRGQSIDLSEIESAILSFNAVSEVVIVPYSTGMIETESLIACVVPMVGAKLMPIELRQYLAKKLPLYMIPSGYVFMESLPHTSTGKVDRLALSKLDMKQLAYKSDYFEPRNELEHQIALIFSEILQTSPISRFDDFFLIGGDSINMVQLHAAFKKQFNVDLQNLHEDATPIGIARKVDILMSRINRMPRIIPLRTQGNKPPLFLVHGRFGQAFVSPGFVDLLGEDQPLYAIQAKGLDGLESPHSSVSEMAEEYVNVIRRQQPQGPYFIGALCAGSYVAIEMARILQSQNVKVLPLLLFDPTPKFAKIKKNLPTAEVILEKLNRHIAKGTINNLSPKLIDSSIYVAQVFENALRKHQINAYTGSVFLLVSGQRLEPSQWSASKLRHLFGHHIECHQVSEKHLDVLSLSNSEFKRVLKSCLNKIYQGILPIDNIDRLNIHHEKSYKGIHYWRRRLWRFFGI
jgi:acyl-coenzyme A synthetase/AMP-(fatty) acid ligase/thioesterase domain-containing protein/aryl carrier-like protein